MLSDDVLVDVLFINRKKSLSDLARSVVARYWRMAKLLDLVSDLWKNSSLRCLMYVMMGGVSNAGMLQAS